MYATFPGVAPVCGPPYRFALFFFQPHEGGPREDQAGGSPREDQGVQVGSSGPGAGQTTPKAPEPSENTRKTEELSREIFRDSLNNVHIKGSSIFLLSKG